MAITKQKVACDPKTEMEHWWEFKAQSGVGRGRLGRGEGPEAGLGHHVEALLPGAWAESQAAGADEVSAVPRAPLRTGDFILHEQEALKGWEGQVFGKGVSVRELHAVSDLLRPEPGGFCQDRTLPGTSCVHDI